MELQPLDTLFSELLNAQQNGFPFVVFRYPNSNEIQLWVQESTELIQNSDFDMDGFVFAPFELSDGVILFPSGLSKQFKADLTDLEVSASSKSSTSLNLSYTKNYHMSLVDFGIQFLNISDCQKVVLSREEKVEVGDFDVIEAYKRMLVKYKNACVYLWSHPEVGTWMGASPERLLKFEGGNVETTSLAGTQAYADNLNWETKELEEQQIVTDYITEVLDPHLETIEKNGPKTSKAGTLAHLKTVISGKLNDSSSLKDIIEKLHPTPAVCGMPKKISMDFLITNENYNREFYTGFFGELNRQNTTHLYVNLRCMKHDKDRVSIYVGGGITAASQPEKEWEETVAKANIMKAIL